MFFFSLALSDSVLLSLYFFFFLFILIRSLPLTYALSSLAFFFKTARFSVRSVNYLRTKSYIWPLLWSEISDRTFNTRVENAMQCKSHFFGSDQQNYSKNRWQQCIRLLQMKQAQFWGSVMERCNYVSVCSLQMYALMLLGPEKLTATVGHYLLPELRHWRQETSGGKAYRNIQMTDSCQC